MVKKYRVSVDEIKPLDVGEEEGFRGVDSRLLISDETVGSESACLFRAIFPSGAYHGKHVHLKSDELLYGLSGRALQGIGDTEYEIGPGVAMIIPRGEVHWLRNDFGEPFEAIGIYPDALNFEDTDQHLVDKK